MQIRAQIGNLDYQMNRLAMIMLIISTCHFHFQTRTNKHHFQENN